MDIIRVDSRLRETPLMERNHATYQCAIPVEQPDLLRAAEGHEDVLLLGADVALLVPLPAEVPLLLAALGHRVAVHSPLQVGVYTENGVDFVYDG